MRDRAEDKIILTFIRHGKTRMNLEKRYIGRTDEPLAEEGRAEIIKLWPGPPEAELIFVSPMKRCIETALLIFPEKKAEDFISVPEWREMDFGVFEGKNYNELNGDPRYQAWIDSGGTLGFPGGEDMESFKKRVHAGMDKFFDACKNYRNTDGIIKAAAVVHGGTIMALMSELTGRDYYDFRIKNGEAIRTEIG